jgi:hypothetical protein
MQPNAVILQAEAAVAAYWQKSEPAPRLSAYQRAKRERQARLLDQVEAILAARWAATEPTTPDQPAAA